MLAATYNNVAYHFDSVGDLKHVLYPSISIKHPIVFTNEADDESITVALSFAGVSSSTDLWYKTLRLTATESDNVGATTYTCSLAPEASVTLWLFSKATEVGWGRSYPTAYWSSSNVGNFDGALINNELTTANAARFNATGAAYIQLTLAAGDTQEFTAIKLNLSGAHNEVYATQYSDDGTTWYTAATAWDLSGSATVAWLQWESVGAHRYWRLTKVSSPADTNYITELQWLLFIPSGAKDFGVYGDKKAYLQDTENQFSMTVTANVGVAITQAQIGEKHAAIGKTGSRTFEFDKRLQQYGQLTPLYYYPAAAAHPPSEEYDYPYPPAVGDEPAYKWLVKTMAFPQKRNLTYGDTLRMTLNQAREGLYYEQRQIYLSPYGPSGRGWYSFMISSTSSHGYHPSPWFIVLDRICFLIDDLRPVYAGEQLVAVHAAITNQNPMKFILDPILGNKGFVLTKIVDADYASDNPEFIDSFTIEAARDFDTKYMPSSFTDFDIYH
jgi:hypothetical protein